MGTDGQMVSVSTVDPGDCMAQLELRLCTLPSIRERIGPRITSLEKIKIQNLKYGFS